jgi:tetratricopeptide (TPR) repeat protein
MDSLTMTRAWVPALLLLGACSTTPGENDLAPSGPTPAKVTLSNAELQGDPLPAARKLIDRRETPGALDHAITLLEGHLPREPQTVELRVMLAEAHSRCLEVLDVKKQGDLASHEQHRSRGRFHAQEALRLAPNHGVAHYWLGCLLLHSADAERSYGRLKEALPHLELAQKQVPTTDDGGPARMLGRVYQETPGGLLLGSNPEAIKWYKKSLDVAPDSIPTHLWLGETYLAARQPALARPELERVVAIKPRGGHEKEEAEYRQKAEVLIQKLPAR